MLLSLSLFREDFEIANTDHKMRYKSELADWKAYEKARVCRCTMYIIILIIIFIREKLFVNKLDKNPAKPNLLQQLKLIQAVKQRQLH